MDKSQEPADAFDYGKRDYREVTIRRKNAAPIHDQGRASLGEETSRQTGIRRQILHALNPLIGSESESTHEECSTRRDALDNSGFLLTGISVIVTSAASGEDVTVIWERNGEAYYATIREPLSEIGFHLIVESDGGR